MAWVPGGAFLMGSNDHYPEERPQHQASVEGFWIDVQPVTNARFARFVAATGYVTVAERPLDPAAFPGVSPAALVPGSAVFRRPERRVSLLDHRAWWAYVPGACWRSPEGPGSEVNGRGDHPVVHVAWEDAAAYAAWAGKGLPTEAEWERAARGGLEGAPYAWGAEATPGGRHMANVWQGEFPWHDSAEDGFAGTSPVGSFPPNGFGLLDMIGNVWEWTADAYAPHAPGRPSDRAPACCGAGHHAVEGAPLRVVKGGSHLCAPSYCLRYRPAARQGQEVDSSTSHIGFRCVVRAPGPAR